MPLNCKERATGGSNGLVCWSPVFEEPHGVSLIGEDAMWRNRGTIKVAGVSVRAANPEYDRGNENDPCSVEQVKYDPRQD